MMDRVARVDRVKKAIKLFFGKKVVIFFFANNKKSVVFCGVLLITINM